MCGSPPNALRFCCAAVYRNLTKSMIAARPGGAGRRQQQARVRWRPSRGVRLASRLAHRSAGPPGRALLDARHPGLARDLDPAGKPLRGPRHGAARPAPKLRARPGRGAQLSEAASRVMPCEVRPLGGERRGERSSAGLGAHHLQCGCSGTNSTALCGSPPNALRFCCGGLRRPPPSQQTYPAAGRRAQAPDSSKRGLGSSPELGGLRTTSMTDARSSLTSTESRPVVLTRYEV